MRSLDYASLRSTVGKFNRSLDKLEMPPLVSVFGFEGQPVRHSAINSLYSLWTDPLDIRVDVLLAIMISTSFPYFDHVEKSRLFGDLLR